MNVPIGDASVDVVISQEALLHIPDRRRAMAEAFRILKRQGRLAFTDWVAHAPLANDDTDLLWEGQAVQALESPESYRDLLTDVGFRVRSSDDLTAQWAVLLKARLAMYQKLRVEAAAAGTPSGHDAFHKSYVRLVALMGEGVLGGVRIVGEKE
jgi:SAM-dependent methyltransferase